MAPGRPEKPGGSPTCRGFAAVGPAPTPMRHPGSAGHRWATGAARPACSARPARSRSHTVDQGCQARNNRILTLCWICPRILTIHWTILTSGGSWYNTSGTFSFSRYAGRYMVGETGGEAGDAHRLCAEVPPHDVGRRLLRGGACFHTAEYSSPASGLRRGVPPRRLARAAPDDRPPIPTAPVGGRWTRACGAPPSWRLPP